jgi:hypothetical protein
MQLVKRKGRWDTPSGHTTRDTPLYGIERPVSSLRDWLGTENEDVPMHCVLGPVASTKPVSIAQKARTETRVAVEMNNMILGNGTSKRDRAFLKCVLHARKEQLI